MGLGRNIWWGKVWSANLLECGGKRSATPLLRMPGNRRAASCRVWMEGFVVPPLGGRAGQGCFAGGSQHVVQALPVEPPLRGGSRRKGPTEKRRRPLVAAVRLCSPKSALQDFNAALAHALPPSGLATTLLVIRSFFKSGHRRALRFAPSRCEGGHRFNQ